LSKWPLQMQESKNSCRTDIISTQSIRSIKTKNINAKHPSGCFFYSWNQYKCYTFRYSCFEFLNIRNDLCRCRLVIDAKLNRWWIHKDFPGIKFIPVPPC
jgi:hypothetical protein